jgi:micrococcal nuclease
MKAITGIGLVLIMLWWQFGDNVRIVLEPDIQETVIVTAKVGRVIDGDTFDLADGTRVRLIGVDAPERGKTGYEAATERLRNLLEGQSVELQADVSDTDTYNRLLRYVYVEGDFINEIIAKEGLVDVRSYPPDTAKQAELQSAEDEAKQANLGIWQ